VALESPDKDAKYIHITEATPDTTYYCPCCRGKVLPRAIANNKKYKMQAHFYHDNGGCREEEYVHFICKNWLFEPDFVFCVSDACYTTKNIEVENSYTTTFGLYCPDITIETQEGKIFFVEIKNKSKKDVKYIPKWDELGVDVVEIDIRDVINKKVTEKIPTFSVIYSGGVCHIKSYVSKRKEYLKEQDKANYKQRWRSLDLFWEILCSYKLGEISKEHVLLHYKKLVYDDQLWVAQYVIKKMSCQDLYPELKEELNKSFYEMLNNLTTEYKRDIPTLEITYSHISPQIHIVHCRYKIKYKDFTCFDEQDVRLKCPTGILNLTSKSMIEDGLKELIESYQRSQDKFYELDSLCEKEYVMSLTPISHRSSEKKPLSDLYFKIVFHEYINNQYIKECIGVSYLYSDQITDKQIHLLYEENKKTALRKRDALLIKHALKNNSAYQEALKQIRGLCIDEYLDLKVSSDFRSVWLLFENHEVGCFNYTKNDFNLIGTQLYEYFSRLINLYQKYQNFIIKMQEQINNCANGLWTLQKTSRFGVFELIFSGESYDLVYLNFSELSTFNEISQYIRSRFFTSMKRLASGVGNNIRIIE